MPKKKLDEPHIFSGILEFRLSLEFTLAFKQKYSIFVNISQTFKVILTIGLPYSLKAGVHADNR